MVQKPSMTLRKSFNSRLREEATGFVDNRKEILSVSTHASVRRRPKRRRHLSSCLEFQLTPP